MPTALSGGIKRLLCNSRQLISLQKKRLFCLGVYSRDAKMFLLKGGLAGQVGNPAISRYVAKNGIVIFATRKNTNVRIAPIKNLSSWDMTIFIGILLEMIRMEKT